MKHALKTALTCAIVAVCAVTNATVLFAKDINLYKSAPKAVQKRISAAESAWKAERYQDALEALGADDSDYIILKRTEFATKGNIIYDPVQAAQDYTAQNGTSPRLGLALGHYYFDTFMRTGNRDPAVLRGLLQQASGNFKAAINADCYNAAYLDEYGSTLFYQEDYAGAESAYARAVSLDKKNSQTWYNYAISLLNQGKFTQAIEPAKKALRYETIRQDNYQDYYFLLSDAYYYGGDVKNATKTLDQAKAKFPSESDLYIKQGGLYIKRGNTAQAAQEFKTAYRLAPREDTLTLIMQYYLMQDDIAAPIDFCTSLLDSIQDDDYMTGIVYYDIAQLYSMKGDVAAAAATLDNAEAHLLRTNVGNTIKAQMDEERARLGL